MQTEQVSMLKIHKLTQSQYDSQLSQGAVEENAIYLTPYEEPDLSSYATKDDLQNSFQSIFDLVYPVGSIYMSIVSTNPSIIFGGTWEQIEDKFLLAAGQTYAAGSIGGESERMLTVGDPYNNSIPYLAVYVFKRIS